MTVRIDDASLSAAIAKAHEAADIAHGDVSQWAGIEKYAATRGEDPTPARAAVIADLLGLPVGTSVDAAYEAAAQAMLADFGPSPLREQLVAWSREDFAVAEPLLAVFTGHGTDVEHPVIEVDETELAKLAVWLTAEHGAPVEILLAEVIFFRLLLDGRISREWLAGIAIGLSLVVKPVLGVLLLLPLLNRQWRAVVAGVAVPVIANVVAWPLVADRGNFVHRTLPYIFSTRDYFNSSVLGNGVYYGLPMWLITLLRLGFIALAAGSLWLLYRYYRERDTLFWMLTSSGVLLIASWLALSLAQGYYSMMLFPFLMTVVLPNSVLRNWPAWLATYGFLTLDRWLMWRWPTTGRFLEYMKITYGWSLMLVVVFCVLYYRYLDAKAAGRLDRGIDPPWMADAARERASVGA